MVSPGRPCFQFAVDIEAYRQDRNFYFSLDQMPFPLAQDNDALERAVLEWREEEAAQAWKGFCETFGIPGRTAKLLRAVRTGSWRK